MTEFKIKKAIVSVSNKNKLDVLIEYFEKYKIDVYSTGGTYKHIKKKTKKINLFEISKSSNFSEMLNGRVKTLQPFIHAGILADRNNPTHLKQLKELNFNIFDLVVVNLYPFLDETKKVNAKFNNCIDQIDIGGPTMIRASAKNYLNTVILTDPSQYENFINLAETKKNSVSLDFRKYLAGEAFDRIALYDSHISNWFNNNKFKNRLTLPFEKIKDLRYGENPHQKSSLYKINDNPIKQLSGKELSYNNIIDIEIAIQLSFELKQKSCVIVKHGNPCGVASDLKQNNSYAKAHRSDSISAFGGIIAFNTKLLPDTARNIKKQFCEIVVAPKITKEARKILSPKKNLILIEYKKKKIQTYDFKSTYNFLLVQEHNLYRIQKKKLKLMSNRKPTQNEINDVVFANNVCKYVNSNAIVIVKNFTTLGIGGGQTNRIDSASHAIERMKKNKNLKKNLILASDGFFPFPDIIELCKSNSISTIIQPGGSKNDQQVIDSCNRNNISLLFSNIRQFKH